MIDIEGFLMELDALTRKYGVEIGMGEDETALYPLEQSGHTYGYVVEYRHFSDGSGLHTGLRWVDKVEERRLKLTICKCSGELVLSSSEGPNMNLVFACKEPDEIGTDFAKQRAYLERIITAFNSGDPV